MEGDGGLLKKRGGKIFFKVAIFYLKFKII